MEADGADEADGANCWSCARYVQNMDYETGRKITVLWGLVFGTSEIEQGQPHIYTACIHELIILIPCKVCMYVQDRYTPGLRRTYCTRR